MANEREPFTKIANVGNLIEAQVLEAMLKERGIPYRMRSFHDTAYDGLFQFQKGWGAVYAPVAHKKEILDIIKEVRGNSTC